MTKGFLTIGVAVTAIAIGSIGVANAQGKKPWTRDVQDGKVVICHHGGHDGDAGILDPTVIADQEACIANGGVILVIDRDSAITDHGVDEAELPAPPA
jgi:hypothetical protein